MATAFKGVLAVERAVAIEAVGKAMQVCRQVYGQLCTGDTEIKSDASPVTVADYAAQAVVNTVLLDHFPEVRIVGEEDAATLQETDILSQRITHLANSVLDRPRTTKELLAAIDRGTFAGGASGQHWTLDPIDGTKGFLRGGQYAVCLALIRNGEVELGVLGCPNLPVQSGQLATANATESGDTERGVMFIATRNGGAFQRTCGNPAEQSIHLRALPTLAATSATDFSSARFCESWEAAHSDHRLSEQIAQRLGIREEPARLDSQCKYGVVARGEADIYLRLPTRADYVEKIWDHAAGSLIVTEAGATVTDADGEPLNFGRGRLLSDNRGVIVAHRNVHTRVLEAVRHVLSRL